MTAEPKDSEYWWARDRGMRNAELEVVQFQTRTEGPPIAFRCGLETEWDASSFAFIAKIDEPQP